MVEREESPRPLPHKIAPVQMKLPKDLAERAVDIEDQVYLRTFLNANNDLLSDSIDVRKEIRRSLWWNQFTICFCSIVCLATMLLAWALRGRP